MSVLIDYFVKQNSEFVSYTYFNGKYFLAKPVRLVTIRTLWFRIKDACRVLVGSSFAVHYADDSTDLDTNQNLALWV